MEKVVANELSKTLMLLGMGVAGISALFIKMMLKVRGSIKQYQAATIAYALVACLLFAVVACTGYWSALAHHLAFYTFYQLCFFALGMAHIRWMHTFLKWSGDGAQWLELVFTLVTALLGSMAFILVFRLFSQENAAYDMATGTGAFILPWFILHTFQRAINMPSKILKFWYYPVYEELKEPDETRLKNLRIISFEFQKQTADKHTTSFRAKAPAGMDLGELFYFFLNDYNARHPDGPIQFTDGNGAPYGWTFCQKPAWYTLFTKYADAAVSVQSNRIRENDVIICNRSHN